MFFLMKTEYISDFCFSDNLVMTFLYLKCFEHFKINSQKYFWWGTFILILTLFIKFKKIWYQKRSQICFTNIMSNFTHVYQVILCCQLIFIHVTSVVTHIHTKQNRKTKQRPRNKQQKVNAIWNYLRHYNHHKSWMAYLIFFNSQNFRLPNIYKNSE